MKSKFFIYFLPITLVCVFILGYSTMDNPKNDVAPDVNSVENSNLSKSDLIESKAPIAIRNLNSRFINEPIQSDTIAPTGFPYNVQFNWNYSLIPNVNGGTVGATMFKNKWYLNRWNSAQLFTYNNDGPGGGPGTFSDSNSAYNGGTGSIRDMTVAPDGSGTEYLWGGTAGTILYKMDSLGNQISSYNHAGAAYRIIAWDPNRKGFWSSNFSGNIVCRDTLGNVLGTVVTALGGKYGLGFDSSTVADSAYLWVWRQIDNLQNQLVRINLANSIETESYTFNNTGLQVGLAGGAEVMQVDTSVFLALNFQNQAIIAYDIKNKIPPPSVDVGVESINDPTQVTNVNDLPVQPSVTVKNYGTSAQAFDVRLTSTSGYDETVSVPSLAPGASSIITSFPTWTAPMGRYDLTATALLGDPNSANDSKTISTEVYRTNWGGGYAGTGGYYFANSTPSGDSAPSNPSFKRIDTTGSTSLVVNGVASVAPTVGTLDDGQWAIVNPGGPTKKVVFMGVEYDSIFIGTNGIVAFTNFVANAGPNWYPPAGGLPAPGAGSPPVRPAFYPLWGDLNFLEAAVPVNRLSYKVDNAKNLLLITWDNAPLWGATAAFQQTTMQVCIELKENVLNGGGPTNSNLTAYIDSSSYTNGPILSGVQNATGSAWLQYLYFDGTATVLNDGPIYQGGAAGVAIAFGPNPNDLNGCCKSLDLTFNLEACPDPGAATVYLRESTAPYAIVDSSNGFGGGNTVSSFDFSNIANGVPYYVVVRTANSVETWSATTVTFSGLTASYDFTSALSQAYGSNQVDVSGVASIYQGDSNQDGFVNSTDVLLVYNNAIAFLNSPNTDFNCDGSTDVTDILLASNNGNAFIGAITP